MCRVRGTMVEADKLQMDLSPSGSVISIAPLHLMIPGTFPHLSYVQTLVSLEVIVAPLKPGSKCPGFSRVDDK